MKINKRKFCECGCRQIVKNRFVHGHNKPTLGKGKLKSPAQLCKCGCGTMTRIGRKFISGHNSKSDEAKENNRQKHLGKPAWNKGMIFVVKQRKPCLCGCGELASKGRTYINGHSGRGKALSQEQKEKIRKALTGRKNGPPSKETILKISISNKGQKRSKEHCLKMSKILKSMNLVSPNKGKTFNSEWKNKLSLAKLGKPSPRKGKHLSEASKKKLHDANIGKKLSEETKLKIGLAAKGRKTSEDTKIKISNAVKGHWKNEKITEKRRKAFLIHPNKPETIVLNLLNKLFPNKWKFTGDLSLMINGKNPDFAHVKQKKLIELFGDYWHKGQNPKDRENIFKPFGYRTLIIWENELKNLNKVSSKIKKFHIL